jgi:hypothetical protein
MYVFCVGMYRSCSTWQYQVVGHLIEQHFGGRRLGFMTAEQFASWDKVEGETQQSDWLVLKSHSGDERLGDALAGGRARALYAYRDLRDVAYSLMHKTRSDFDEIVVRGRVLLETIRDDHFWRDQQALLSLRYEDLVADPVAGVRAIATHLGLSLASGEAEAVADEYSLGANQRRTVKLTRRLRKRGVDLSDPNNALLYDPDSLLHWNHLRDGRVGTWREQATPSQRRILADLCGDWLIERGYESDSEWARVPEAPLPGSLCDAGSSTISPQINRGPRAARERRS